MTTKVLGGGSVDGQLGENPDWINVEASLNRQLWSVDEFGKLSGWLVESTQEVGGQLLANGLYANPKGVVSDANVDNDQIVSNTNVIKSILVSEGLSGEYGYFADGFTINDPLDVGIDASFQFWKYVGAETLPYAVPAGTDPSAGDWELIELNSASSIQITTIESPRSVDEKINETISAIDEGADKTGLSSSSSAFTALETKSNKVYVPFGKYDSGKSQLDANVDYSASPEFLDSETSEFAPNVGISRLADLTNAFSGIMKTTWSGQTPKIVCYGDSNTRYYEGDETVGDGPLAKSYGQWIDYLATFEPSLYAADVTVNGYPGNRAQFGLDNFAANVPSDTNFVVIGFGTNDVKLTNPDLDGYITSMKGIIASALTQDTTPIVLSIPWYSLNYGNEGTLSTERIRVWNAHLLNLCNQVGIPFIDTYNLTRTFPSAYFNEATVQRHYDANATRVIASKIIMVLRDLMTSYEPASTNIDKMTDLGFIKSTTGSVVIKEYNVGGRSFNAIEIPQGGSISINAAGRGCIGFYPRANATVNINTDHQNVNKTITATLDKTFYQITRQALSFDNAQKIYTLTITATTGSCYVRCLSFQDGLIYASDHGILSQQKVVSSDLPVLGIPNRKYFLTDLLKEAYYVSGDWIGPEGLVIVGTTTQRNAVESYPAPLGYKFYNTDTSQAEKWNGTSWVAI